MRRWPTGSPGLHSNTVPRWPGAAAALAVAALCLAPLFALIWRAGGTGAIGAADLAALRFTLWQAVLSAALSILPAIPVARALARRRFAGRSAVIALLGAPFILPVLVAVIGLLAIFGRGGVLNDLLALAGLPRLSIYGLTGVLLAHVFLNLPLAVRMILTGWQAIPEDRFRLAASLGAPVGRTLEWPMLRAVLPGAFLVIFLVCLSSFTVTLTLGGGPAATTLELAIYQALRFDFAPDRAATLALLQLATCALAAGLAGWVTVPQALGLDPGRSVARWDRSPVDWVWIGAAILFLILPLIAVLLRGLPGLAEMPASVWPALARTVAVAVAATALALAAAVALALHGGRLAMLAGSLPLAISGLAMGAGLLLLTLPFGPPGRFALPVTVLVNATGALPFALRIIGPEIARILSDHARLADSLGLLGMARVRLVVLPLARRPLGFAAGLAAALSAGDLGVIALFGATGQETLPLVMVGLMGAYQMQAAAGAALLLSATAFGLFLLCDLWGRHGSGS